MMRVTLEIVGRALFSVDLSDDTHALGDAFAIANDDSIFRTQHPLYPPPFVPTPRNRRSRAARLSTAQIIMRLIPERVASETLRSSGQAQNDLLSLLMGMRDEQTGQGLSVQELERETLVMLFAGHETTSNALTWTFYFLSQDKEVETKLRAELDAILNGRAPTMEDVPQLVYTRRVLDETMRLAPPAWVMARKSLEFDTLGDYSLPALAIVLISPYIHRHPRYWKNPDAFDPERFAPEYAAQHPRFTYMPFGGGPGLCIGQPFALAEATLLLAAIAQRYRLHLVPNTTVEPDPQITLRVKGGLSMTLEPR